MEKKKLKHFFETLYQTTEEREGKNHSNQDSSIEHSWNKSPVGRNFAGKDELWKSISNKTNNSRTIHVMAVFRFLSRNAAIFLLLVGLSGAAYWWFSHADQATSTLAQTYETPRGERAKFILPDGTIMFLNAASKVKLEADFNKEDRRLSLTGEAYFDVTHQAEKPFIVEMSKAEIRVLGTAFNVKAYSEDELVTASLDEGSVSFTPGNQSPRILVPGEALIFSKRDGKIEMKKNRNYFHASWKNGELIFDNTQLEAILPVLERWFNQDIQMDDALRNKHRITMTIRNETLGDVLELLSMSSGIHIKKEENRIHLY